MQSSFPGLRELDRALLCSLVKVRRVIFKYLFLHALSPSTIGFAQQSAALMACFLLNMYICTTDVLLLMYSSDRQKKATLLWRYLQKPGLQDRQHLGAPDRLYAPLLCRRLI